MSTLSARPVRPEDAGRVGPNAITRMAEALLAREGEPARRLVFLAAGLARYIASPPDRMVPEAEVSALHAAAVEVLGPARAALVAVEAGHLTGDYLLARRIPAAAQALLRVLPRRWAASLLVRAIARHAWTFGGSGQFSYDWQDGLRLHLTDSPVCRAVRTGMPACDYLAATFERVFRAMLGPSVTVREVGCLSSGQHACTFLVRWAGART